MKIFGSNGSSLWVDPVRMCTVGAAGPEKLAWICVVDTWGKGWHTMIVRCEITTHRWCGLLSCAVMMGSSCSRGQSTQDRNRAECMRSCHNDLLIRYTWQFYPSMQQARISAVLLVWWLPYSCFLSVCVCVSLSVESGAVWMRASFLYGPTSLLHEQQQLCLQDGRAV